MPADALAAFEGAVPDFVQQCKCMHHSRACALRNSAELQPVVTLLIRNSNSTAKVDKYSGLGHQPSQEQVQQQANE
jgi:hypothetical protein